jgi:single-strand DNA-binding protein
MASRSLNKVILIGNLTRDPELRYTPAGTAVCTFGLATNRGWTTQTGETREETEFHRIVSWNKLAELCSQLLVKGRKVYVEGRLATHTWVGQDGAQRSSTEIVIEDMIILDSKRPVREEAPVPTSGEPQAVPAVSKEAAVSPAVPATSSASDTPSKTKKTAKKPPAEEKAKEEAAPASTTNEEITPEDIPF